MQMRIEGPPYFVESMQITEDQMVLNISGGWEENLCLDSLFQDLDGHLYCRVKEQSLVAMFCNHALMQLEPWMHQRGDQVYINFLGKEYDLPRRTDASRYS